MTFLLSVLSFIRSLRATTWLWIGLRCTGFVGGCYVRGKFASFFGPQAPVGSMGWVNDPQAVQATLATMPRPVFADAAPNLMGAPDQDALLYHYAEKAIGHLI